MGDVEADLPGPESSLNLVEPRAQRSGGKPISTNISAQLKVRVTPWKGAGSLAGGEPSEPRKYRPKRMRPGSGRGAGSPATPAGCVSLFLFYPGARFAHPPLISSRPAGAEYVTHLRNVARTYYTPSILCVARDRMSYNLSDLEHAKMGPCQDRSVSERRSTVPKRAGSTFACPSIRPMRGGNAAAIMSRAR